MARYFVYCENHGQIGGYYSTPEEASQKRKEYLLNTPGVHGRVKIIEEYNRTKYGRDLTYLRQYR